MPRFRLPPTRPRAGPPGRPGNRTGQMVSRWCVLVTAVLVTGCVGYVGRAKAVYDQGRYLQVVEDLAPREGELQDLSPADRAQYAMYLGLSWLELNELEEASRWLTYCLAVEKAAPGSLAPDQRLRVEQARLTLRDSLRERASSPPPPREARPAATSTTTPLDESRHRDAK